MPPHKPITLVLARFEDLFAGGLRELIEGDRNLEIVAADIEQQRIAVVLRGHKPAVAVLDAQQLGELTVLRDLGREHPGTRLVVVANAMSVADCAQALAFGASAYLGRDTQGRDILSAIHLASRGLQVVPRALSSGQETRSSRLLTAREGEVLPLLQSGRSNAEIALELHVGVETVRTHTRSIYRKLGVSARRELTTLDRR